MNDRISITIKPTLSCNMRCRHCYHADSNYPDDILDIHRVERILNIASNEYSTLDILIHGGEPTFCGSEYLNSIFLIEKKIENVKGTKFYNTIQTNGLELNSEIIDILTQNNCSIGISLAASPKLITSAGSMPNTLQISRIPWPLLITLGMTSK